MSYCTIANITDRIGEAALITLTDDEGTGDVVDALVTAAIAAAAATIDAYCQGRYTVPLATVPAKVAELCQDIAVYELYSRSDLVMPEVRKDRYNAAIRFLEKVAAGTIALGAATPAPADTNNSVDFDSNRRIFNRDKLRNF
jgi:phage gp36-like protein